MKRINNVSKELVGNAIINLFVGALTTLAFGGIILTIYMLILSVM